MLAVNYRVKYNKTLKALPYSMKVWQEECLANLLCPRVWQKIVWQMLRSANRLLIVRTKLNDFSLANYRCFAKFGKNFPLPNFPAIQYVTLVVYYIYKMAGPIQH